MSQIQIPTTSLSNDQHLLSDEPEIPRNYGSISDIINDDGNNESNDDNHNEDNDNKISVATTLTFFQKIGYGFGHIFNDLCAGMWFSYTLLYLQSTQLIPAPIAGSLVMLGQISDAISTPIVGILSDRYSTKRKWHIFGTGLVFFSFPVIFSICPNCNITDKSWWPPLFLSSFIIVFQFGWAVVQITHLSMIPELSRTKRDRNDLTATRYSASIISNSIVYIITWFMLQGHTKFNTISVLDGYRFRDISLLLTLIGTIMFVLFQLSLSLTDYDQRRLYLIQSNNKKDRDYQQQQQQQQEQQSRSIEEKGHIRSPLTDHQSPLENEARSLLNNDVTNIPNTNDNQQLLNKGINQYQYLNTRNILKSTLLYQNALLYVFARLFMTTSLVYMPLWLDERSKNSSNNLNIILNDTLNDIPIINNNISIDHLATVPLVSFFSSFISSTIIKYINHLINNDLSYLIGSIIGLIGCILIGLQANINLTSFKLFIIAILLGAGSSITMISSLCITADMIGSKHTQNGGFIYSSVTFADKLITGIVVVVIESLKCLNQNDDCPNYYRDVLSYACGTAAICGIIVLITLKFNCNRYLTDNNRRRLN